MHVLDTCGLGRNIGVSQHRGAAAIVLGVQQGLGGVGNGVTKEGALSLRLDWV